MHVDHRVHAGKALAAKRLDQFILGDGFSVRRQKNLEDVPFGLRQLRDHAAVLRDHQRLRVNQDTTEANRQRFPTGQPSIKRPRSGQSTTDACEKERAARRLGYGCNGVTKQTL